MPTASARGALILAAACHVESRLDRRSRSRALANFFAAGALLSTAVLLLPGWEQVRAGPIVVTIVLAALGAIGLHAFAERVGPYAVHAITACGTGLIAACQVFAGGGSPTAMYAMLYIWVILHCSLFFPRPVVVAHLGLTTLAHAGALLWLGDVGSIAPQLTVTLGTQVSAALVVTSLAATQRRLADTDSLTGLGNRRMAERALEYAVDRRHRASTSPVGVAVLDLDGFKAFNDRRGHVAGDLLLTRIAQTWRTMIRSTDTLARTGGDEFLLVLLDCQPEVGERLVRRMVARTPGGVAASAGLAFLEPGETVTSLVQRADAALYAAKSEGPVAVAPSGPVARAG